MENSVLTVRDNELNVLDSVGDNEVACWLLPNLGNVWETIWMAQIWLAGPIFPGVGDQNFLYLLLLFRLIIAIFVFYS